MNALSFDQKSELETLEDPQSKLTWLLYYGNEDAVEYIIQEMKVDVNHVPKNGMPPLYKTVVDNVPSMIDILVKHGANVNWENSTNKKSSPLYNACSKNYVKCVKALLKHKPNVDYRFHGKYTSLWKASVEGFCEIVELLCVAGANTEIGGENAEDTPLFAATERGKYKAVEALLKHGANAEATVNGHSVVYKAADHGKHEVLEVLFKYGISPDQHTSRTSSPLYVACQKGKEQVVDGNKSNVNLTDFVLLRYKANVNYKFNVYYTPLWKAAYEGHAHIVEMLIENGSSVTVQAPTGTPLFVASQNGHNNVVEVLLRNNADTEVEVKNTTILAEACKNNHKICAQLLLQYGAKFTKYDKQVQWYKDELPHILVLKPTEISVRSRGFSVMLTYAMNTLFLAYPSATAATSWSMIDGDVIRTFKGHNEEITCMYIKNKALYTASADKRIIMADVETGERFQTLSGHTKAVTCILYHEHFESEEENRVVKKILYSGSQDATVIAWEWIPDSRYTLKCKYSIHKSSITGMCAKNSSIHGMKYDVLYVAAADGSLRGIDIETGKILFTIAAHSDSITSVMEFDDVIYTSSLDCTIKAFDRIRTKCLHTFEVEWPVLCATLSPGGLLICSLDDKKNPGLHIWSCHSKQLLYVTTVAQLTKPITKLFWDGKILFTGAEDGLVQSWELFDLSVKLNRTNAPYRLTFTKGKATFTEINSDRASIEFDDPNEVKTKLQQPLPLYESKVETVFEHESQFKLTQEIFNKLEGMEDQMMVMSKNIQELYLVLKSLESGLEKQKTK